MGLSCGNPTATAHLRPGEVVVDLGLRRRHRRAAGRPQGRPDRQGHRHRHDAGDDRAGRTQRRPVRQGRHANVEFHLARIDALPLPDDSVDCLISNCVINLAPDKPAVFREMFRVLKPGGRVAVSDIALKQPLPPEVGQDIAGLRRLHRRGDPDRGVRADAARGRVRGGAGRGHEEGPERLRQGRERQSRLLRQLLRRAARQRRTRTCTTSWPSCSPATT